MIGLWDESWWMLLDQGEYAALATAVFAGMVGALFFAVIVLRLLMWVFGWFGLRT